MTKESFQRIILVSGDVMKCRPTGPPPSLCCYVGLFNSKRALVQSHLVVEFTIIWWVLAVITLYKVLLSFVANFFSDYQQLWSILPEYCCPPES